MDGLKTRPHARVFPREDIARRKASAEIKGTCLSRDALLLRRAFSTFVSVRVDRKISSVARKTPGRILRTSRRPRWRNHLTNAWKKIRARSSEAEHYGKVTVQLRAQSLRVYRAS